jgi:hypothetical protein
MGDGRETDRIHDLLAERELLTQKLESMTAARDEWEGLAGKVTAKTYELQAEIERLKVQADQAHAVGFRHGCENARKGCEAEIERLKEKVAHLLGRDQKHASEYNALHRQKDVVELQAESFRKALELIASCEKRTDGDVVDIAQKALAGTSFTRKCAVCDGTGKHRMCAAPGVYERQDCPICKGSGSEKRDGVIGAPDAKSEAEFRGYNEGP